MIYRICNKKMVIFYARIQDNKALIERNVIKLKTICVDNTKPLGNYAKQNQIH